MLDSGALVAPSTQRDYFQGGRKGVNTLKGDIIDMVSSAGMGGIIAGIATLYGLGSLELSEIARSVRRRMWHRKPLSPGISVAGVPAIDEEEGK